MGKKARRKIVSMDSINCACLIHDTAYDWQYVTRLYNSLCRNLTPEVKLHVYTESSRPVPAPFIPHALQEWPGIRGPKSSWWYKVQLFDSTQFDGNLLYFDLDTVITGNIDWIWQQPPGFFYAPKDFKYLFRPKSTTINSSVMWFNTKQFDYVYRSFDSNAVVTKRLNFRGDQDYIHHAIPENQLRYLDNQKIRSYKWEIKEGGWNFKTRKPLNPGAHSIIDDVSVLIFHGNPKPHELGDPIVRQNWR